ncbi:RNA polymerase sigma-54 factor [Anaerobacillus alkaliphilus]|uniref:RNA polymerase sigma-54 factor n=2 Tax=Anaerobacillus alkaliphilus TaxID=1548597 RepID=A0A4V1LGJ2_9BACI|nr:RNA polymerase sigma-54 factor [Anaerobacillus alkaliphilus]
MDFGLYQQQSMKLVMTNELRQAISILQYSTQELLSFIEEQQLENPLLEVKEKRNDDKLVKKSEVDYENAADWKVYEGEQTSPLDYLSKNEASLQNYLFNQIRFMPLSKSEKRVITYLIYSLDENGYFTGDLEEVASRFVISKEKALFDLQVLQSLEPAGVAARNLQECLLLQLRKLERRNETAEQIVEHYLDMFANKKWKEIAKALSITLEDVQSVADLIQTLQPRPGAIYNHEPSTYISPDVFIELVDGEFRITINDRLLPNVTVSRDYRELLDKASDETSAKYVQQKYQQILWLVKSLDQRQQTLLKVTDAIARHQEAFFKFGYEHLKPLTLKEIAAEIDVHESTVSRVTTQKYVQTPRGLFELKYFFSSSLKTDDGNGTSSLSVKEFIKKVVDQENKQKPLSDQKIVDILEKENSIEVSRRTVTKYREELNIPSSSKRKRF